MFKAIWHEKQILIVLLWSVLIFIGYNILTVEASEKNDKKICEEYNGKWKDIGGGDRGCVIDNEKDTQKYSIRPGYSLDSTGAGAEYGIEDLVSYDKEGNKVYPNTDSPKEICKNHDGKWKDGTCTFPNDNERQDAEVGFDHTMEEEGLWDNYAAEQEDKKVEQACDKAGLKMTKDGNYCDTNNEKGEDDADKFFEEYDKVEREKQEDLPNKSGYQYSEPAKEEESEESSYEYEESSDESEEEEEEEQEDESEDDEQEEDEPEEDNSYSES